MSRAARAYVADVERKAPIKRRAFTIHVNRQVAVQVDKKAQVRRDAATYDDMTSTVLNEDGQSQDGAARRLGMRPLKPPTLPANMPTVRSAGSRGLEPQRLKAPPIFWTGEGWRL